MSSKVSTATSSGGVGLFGLMFLLFLGLKLGNVITWSWWWVTAPLWGPPALFIGIVAIIWLFATIISMFAGGK